MQLSVKRVETKNYVKSCHKPVQNYEFEVGLARFQMYSLALICCLMLRNRWFLQNNGDSHGHITRAVTNRSQTKDLFVTSCYVVMDIYVVLAIHKDHVAGIPNHKPRENYGFEVKHCVTSNFWFLSGLLPLAM